MRELKVLELFAGIGACTKALQRLKLPFKVVDAVEIDKYAIQSYNALYGANFEPQDIRDWEKHYYCENCHYAFMTGCFDPQDHHFYDDVCPNCGALADPLKVDLIMHGSPCQDISIAGKQAGAIKGSETRSSLLYESLRIIEDLKPTHVIWENVKNLLSDRHRPVLEDYCSKLKQWGYKNYVMILNAKDFGVPQNRERVFTISTKGEFTQPAPQPLQQRLADLLETDVPNKYYLSDEKIRGMEIVGLGNQVATLPQIKGHNYNKRVYDPQKISPTLPTITGGNQVPKILVQQRSPYGRMIRKQYDSHKTKATWNEIKELRPREDGLSNTLTGVKKDNLLLEGTKIRTLTPREFWRLMGFNDSDFDKVKDLSDTQLYKQAGNSIVVNVLEAVLSGLCLSVD